MNRILKENATVPLFFAQTLIQSLRDVGYNHTTSALCEHVDNAIQAGASEVRIFFRQSGGKGEYEIDAGVYDNGRGMSPTVLKVATAFGGSMNYGNRNGIARFGMGMKTAALSMCPVMELHSWQEPQAIYSMTLDVEAIGKERANLVELPEPNLSSEFPDEIADFFHKPLSYPTNRAEQELFVSPGDDLYERLGPSGTIVYMPRCDRLTYAKAKTLVDHAVKEMSRVYRRAIADGLRLYVNNRLVEAFDPTYAMANARHSRFLGDEPKQSRLIVNRTLKIKLSENAEETAPIQIRIYRLPLEEWYGLPRKTLRNDLRVFDGLTVSILRNNREVFAGALPKITTRHSVTHWYRIQIDFPGVLDEAFGVAANKQGVRMKGYVEDAIKEEIGDEITTINDEIKRFQAAQASARAPAKPSTSEAKAGDADAFQVTPLAPVTPEEEAQLDANLRGLALTLKRDGETEEEAFARVKSSKYIIDFRHDEYWPFYDVKHHFGRVILTVNTAHPFFTGLYDPVSKMSAPNPPEETDDVAGPASETQDGPIVALDLLLLSLARTQGRLAGTSDDARKLLEGLRREWSETYRVQMTA
ncbi:MAG TPA: ATP-binding protein [Alphaproteobacteria bacterium]|nr:ATP-binding protein [Alphaproteobacteria bacterium]